VRQQTSEQPQACTKLGVLFCGGGERVISIKNCFSTLRVRSDRGIWVLYLSQFKPRKKVLLKGNARKTICALLAVFDVRFAAAPIPSSQDETYEMAAALVLRLNHSDVE
jgi:hypothetical protein